MNLKLVVLEDSILHNTIERCKANNPVASHPTLSIPNKMRLHWTKLME